MGAENSHNQPIKVSYWFWSKISYWYRYTAVFGRGGVFGPGIKARCSNKLKDSSFISRLSLDAGRWRRRTPEQTHIPVPSFICSQRIPKATADERKIHPLQLCTCPLTFTLSSSKTTQAPDWLNTQDIHHGETIQAQSRGQAKPTKRAGISK